MSNETPVRAPFPAEDSFYPQSDAGLYRRGSALPLPRRRFQHAWWKHILLFVITVATTTAAGILHYAAFLSDFDRSPVVLGWDVAAGGFWYSGTLLLILGAHEMGHYLLCRRYNVDATLPYFLPAPLPLTGTLGAVIRIREAFPSRAALFDIGVAGPIAGFVVLLPALFFGMSLSHVTLDPPASDGLLALGEPLLFQWAVQIVFGAVPQGHTVNMHPMVFAAWFGMLATALNLLPFGQLDGGHLTYATLGRWSVPISIATVAGAIGMTFVSTSWMFMTVMLVLMFVLLGPRHPRVLNEDQPLGAGRIAIAVFGLVMLIVCFTPVPIEPYDLIRNP